MTHRMMPDLTQLVRRWPLVDRPRPLYPPLTERITEVSRLAHATKHAADPLLAAAQTLNAAALIASDCALPELAHELCWRQINPYRQAGRLTIGQARHMLEPVINLARLRLRAGDAEAAKTLLDTLHQAIETNTDATVEGRTLPIRNLTGSAHERRELRVWAWRVYLAEITRALVSLGRWPQALAHIERNKGIGLHLMDGRQVKIIVACLAGDIDAALGVLTSSTLTEPWEEQVCACLTVLCHLAGDRPAGKETDVMIERYLTSRPAPPGHAVFQTRLGLAVVDLASLTAPATTVPVCARLISDAMAAADGYVARELLDHPRCTAMLTGTEKQALEAAVQAAGLGLGAIPAPLMADLLTAAHTSETALGRALRPSAPAVTGHAPP